MYTGLRWEKEDLLWIDYEIMGDGNNTIPLKYSINDNYLQDQSLKRRTAYMCTAFAATSWANEVLHKYNFPKRYSWEVLGEYMVTKGLLDVNFWAYLIDAVKCAKELKYLDGYTTVRTIEQVKLAISHNKPLVVWSNRIDWKFTEKSPFIVREKASYWHAFLVTWYDDETQLLECENSYWNKFNKWRFYIKYSDFHLLYPSKFALHINDDKFIKLNNLIKDAKVKGYKSFMDELMTKSWRERMYYELASQLVFLKKVNNKKLLELIK